ncbi:LGFP repeat-containing protein [Spirosoma endbachense]|uniref:LGFP repeat-containing protein n=1 Tax=Spirosoma endbachense TaxID=2666025 RepID=A0A6P1W6R0_9BACT|nr:hypothetical protein [Spirosoma endbachense]QHW00259.1 hypothetical protein GJR95_36870 [Spirosoma endbachense]
MIQIYLSSIRCVSDTSELTPDEPYVLVTVVNLAATPVPTFDVTLYAFDGVSSRETHYSQGISSSFWGINARPAQLTDPNNVIFLVTLMENDDGNPQALRSIVKGIVGSSILGSLSLDRTNKVMALLRDVNSASGTPTGGPNYDDKIGPSQELVFSMEDLARAERGELIQKTTWSRGDGGSYTMTFEAVNEFGVFGAIRDKWVAAGRVSGRLGKPVSDEIPTYDGIGRYRNFVGGIISWHPETEAHIVWGSIGARWLQIGREKFGYPINDESPTSDGRGRYNHFRAIHLPNKPESSIHWTPETGAHETYGAIRDKWSSMNWERSHLGYPIEAEHDHAGGRLQRFQGGSLFWTPGGGVVVQ